MRRCGLPETLIEYLPSLITEPVQFYSCFISYSVRDQDFADRLYVDLQIKGVRCWFAPEDLKIGDRFRQRIDEAIRLHDKLLLILSEHSVQSDWVREEVESCLERERREKRLVLFPVRVDEAIMDATEAWAASIRRQRHIGDFKEWKKHDSYQSGLCRLLRDLRPNA
ncbi:MAG: toll/interleukin-1 receptor domain-containing protein [Acidobacteriota bacterium]|nr:toll/interleukin-1 receptor domain-containing protein [Acidobacteriota bacterium]